MSAVSAERLPVRSEPAPWENLAGYVMRLALLNNCPPGPLWVKVMKAARRSAAEAVLLLCVLSDCAPSVVDPLFSRGPVKDRHPTWRPVPGVDIAGSLSDLRARVCPGCLSKRRVAHAAWNVAHYVGCAEHGRYLVDCCPRCRRKLGMHRIDVATCACGFDLAAAESPRMPAAEIEVVGLILDACSGSADAESPPSCPADLVLPDLLRMVVWVGRSPDVSVRSGTGLDSRERHRGIVAKAAPILANWPHGMHAHIRKLVVETPVVEATKDSRYFLGGLNSGMPDANWPGRDMVFAQIAAAFAGRRLGIGLTKLMARPEDPYVGSSEAGRILGIGARAVPALAQRNGIRIQPVRLGRRNGELYAVRDLKAARMARDEAKALRSDWFTAAVVAEMLGLTPHAAQELSELGWLAARKIGRYVYYRGADAERLTAAVALRAEGRLAGRDAVPITVCEGPLEMSPARLLHLVLSGRLSIATLDVGPRNANVGLMSYGLDRAEAEEAVRRVTGTVSFRKAGEELGVGDWKVPRLCAAGFLIEVESPRANWRKVTWASLAAFAKRYICTDEIERRSSHASTRGHGVHQRLVKIGVSPVHVFSLRFCVYERFDVDRALGWDTAADAAAKSD